MEAFWEQATGEERPALILPDRSVVSYSSLYAAADAFAAELPSCRRQLLFILAGNNKESLSAYLGVLRHDHVALLLSKDIAPAMLQALSELYRPAYVYRPEGEGYQLQATGYENPACELNDQLALLLSTSGSTGSPKLVRLSKKNLLSNACSIASYLHLDHRERPITNLPPYYSYGLSILNSHLQVGAALLLTEDSLANPQFWAFCENEKATSMAGVPYTYDMLEAVSFRRKALPSLRTLTQAGGHMDEAMVRLYAEWAEATHRRFFVMYGQTEATARMSYLPPALARQHPNSIGIAIPDGRFSIVDGNGLPVSEPGKPGELIYQGDNVCMGYAQTREDLAAGDVNGGTLRTGDVAMFDEEGLFYITGRLKRFVKIAGNRFGLDELEQRLREQGIEAICGGSDNKLLIAITNENQRAATAQYLKNTWRLLQRQYSISVIDTIPRSETGKILYNRVFP